jgi:hypothetical protein
MPFPKTKPFLSPLGCISAALLTNIMFFSMKKRYLYKGLYMFSSLRSTYPFGCIHSQSCSVFWIDFNLWLLFIFLRFVICGSVSAFGVSAQSMQCSYDRRGNSVPTILLLLQERLYDKKGLRVSGWLHLWSRPQKKWRLFFVKMFGGFSWHFATVL